MKLYKIRSMFGDHGVSVFEPYDIPEDPLDPAEAGQYSETINRLRFLGLSDVQAGQMVYAWMQYAKIKLGMTTTAAYTFARQCAERVGPEQVKPPVEIWPIIILVAVITAVALGLYVWAVLDQELNVTFGTHEWAYCMSYEERLWQGELWGVSKGNVGVYELGVNFGEVIESAARNIGYERWIDSLYFREGSMVLQGRRLIFYHVYRIKGFSVRFCGVLENAAAGLYRLREGGHDPYKPAGVWMRPGGRWGTPEYEGCWQRWWWL